MTSDTPAACTKCGRILANDGHIALWDGHQYCLECVCAHSPQLATFARRNETFVDVVKIFEIILISKFVLSIIVFDVILVAIAVIVARHIVPHTVLLLTVLTTGYVSAYIASHGVQYPQTVRISKGSIHIRTPMGASRHALSTCQWNIDFSFEPGAVLMVPLPPRRRTRAILLQIPSTFGSCNYVMCTDKLRHDVLSSFLTFIDAVSIRPRD
jgi:hypothetical protein